MKYVEIALTYPELYVAGMIGVMRRVASLQNGNDKNKHARLSNWLTDIDGACAEIALAKHLGVYWRPSVNEFKRPDLPPNIQVRSTPHRNGHLIVRENDKPNADHRFVLVITVVPRFILVGSMLGHEAMYDEFFRRALTPDEADGWWVPQDRLSELPCALSQEASAAPLAPSRGEAPFESPRLSTHQEAWCGEPSAQGHEP
jgi:hypothetical protein